MVGKLYAKEIHLDSSNKWDEGDAEKRRNMSKHYEEVCHTFHSSLLIS